MDWKRIKSILIIALLVINGLLLWTMFGDRLNKPDDVIDRTLMLELLSDKNVSIKPEQLDIDKSISNITLQVQRYDEAFVSEVFSRHTNYDTDSIVVPEDVLNVGNKLTFRVEEKNVLSTTYMTDEEIISQAYSLLEELDLKSEDIYIKSVSHTGKKTIIDFGQRHKGFTIKDAYITIKYNNTNLLSFERVWYDVFDNETSPSNFYSMEYALYEFLGKLYNNNPNRKRQAVIKDISLVYQLKQLEEDVNDLAVQGVANIFYEFKTEDDSTFLIEAIDEKRETP